MSVSKNGAGLYGNFLLQERLLS